MARKHTLNITLNNKSAEFSDVVIRYRGVKKYEKVIHQKLDAKHWDALRGNIKQSKQHLYKGVSELIEKYKGKFPSLIDQLNSGDIHPTNVLDAVLGKSLEKVRDLPIIEFIERYKKDGNNNYKKFSTNYGGILFNLQKANYKNTQLEVGMLSDESIIKDIAEIFRDSETIGNVAIEYMKMLDRISRDAKLKNNSLFKKLNLIPKKKSPKRKKVEVEDFQMGINNIKTYKQLEAYLFFLYSYCLNGMDGGNIVDLDESCLIGLKDKKLSHYHFLGDFIFCDINGIDFSHKVRFHRPRNKQEDVPTEGVYNMFPILFIRDWLYYLIKLNRPKDYYKGEDRIRLFNFKINDGKRRSDSGQERWEAIRNTYRSQMKKIFGASLQWSRHTAGQNARNRHDVSDYDIDRLLGHKHKGVNNAYIGAGEVARIDVLQLQNIDEFDVIGTLRMLFRSISKRQGTKYALYSLDGVDTNKHKPYKAWNDNLILGYGLLNLKKKKLEWTINDEVQYQRIQSILNKESLVLNEFGLVEKRKKNIEELSTEEQAVINRKKEIFNIKAKTTFDILENKKLRIYDAEAKKHPVNISDEIMKELEKVRIK